MKNKVKSIIIIILIISIITFLYLLFIEYKKERPIPTDIDKNEIKMNIKNDKLDKEHKESENKESSNNQINIKKETTTVNNKFGKSKIKGKDNLEVESLEILGNDKRIEIEAKIKNKSKENEKPFPIKIILKDKNGQTVIEKQDIIPEIEAKKTGVFYTVIKEIKNSDIIDSYEITQIKEDDQK